MFLTKKHILFISAQLLLLSYGKGQNLVPNPSFEDVNICTEYNAPCAPSAWESVAPESMKLEYMYNAVTVAGNNFIRLVYASPNQARNYAQTQLLCALEKGRKYRITLVAGKDGPGVPELDIHFDTTYIFQEFAGPLMDLDHLRTTAKDVIKETKGEINFYTLQQEFTATEDYGYVLIGSLQQGAFSVKKEYYYIDSISITPVGKQEPLCENAETIKAKLYAQHRRHAIPTAFYWRMQQALRKPELPVKCVTILAKDEKVFTARGRGMEPEAAARLDSVIRLYDPALGMKVNITGHSAKSDSYNFNKVVSLETARKIADILVHRNGFSYDDVAIDGRGNTMPRFDAGTDEGREGNTYVTLEFCIPQQERVAVKEVPPPKPDTLVIPDVLFKFNSSELNAKLYNSLDSLIFKIPQEEAIQLQLLGHTDNVGTDEYNIDLSRKRAMSVAAYLKKKGLGEVIRHVAGMGEAYPVTENDTPEGRKKNRRVEIIIYKGAD
ncbi:OmpA family protein [Chitinophaga sp. SYP-B3965]|uniref:OmpA family protein n=1 Tax=Chitinophaga sp. SYP-B3965 TaxID=2663120 RepID=UPI0012999279|nr:OmpA family protein [Chitinophaga sp. SYP-B3965]MRG46726.1 OmpA family protein [Chitinophaga sp. SYP-B3965]